MSDFKPGDRIVTNIGSVYTVVEPVRTSRGKLTCRGPRGGYVTTWWSPSPASLPRGFRLVTREQAEQRLREIVEVAKTRG